MNINDIKNKVENTQVTWDCIFREDQHEIGCPHKEWTKEQLLDALISKKKFEQSGLAGTVLTK